jgi:hypothetical protein
MAVTTRVVVQMVRKHVRLQSIRTDFQQEWRAARRHEAKRDISPTQ